MKKNKKNSGFHILSVDNQSLFFGIYPSIYFSIFMCFKIPTVKIVMDTV